MLSGFRERANLVKIALVNTYQQDTAYFWSSWASVLSTVMYTLTYLMFLGVVYSNVRTVAGYSRDEMLFFTLVGQVAFYFLFPWIYDNLDDLRRDVNRGNLDLVLTKPVHHLFYLSLRKLTVLNWVRLATVPLSIMALSIRWESIHIEPIWLGMGAVTFICGLICFHVVMFFLMLPVFWVGESGDIFALTYPLSDYSVPYEGFPRFLQVALTTALPTVICAGLSASVMLGKSEWQSVIPLVLAVTAIALMLRAVGWKIALRNYTSASS